jgi:hypothetical protein
MFCQQKNIMLELVHIRFRTAPVHPKRNELSLTKGYWYMQAYRSSVPTGIINDMILNRPCCLFT